MFRITEEIKCFIILHLLMETFCYLIDMYVYKNTHTLNNTRHHLVVTPHPLYIVPHGTFSCSAFKYCIYTLLAQVLLSGFPAVFFFLLGEPLPFNRQFHRSCCTIFSLLFLKNTCYIFYYGSVKDLILTLPTEHPLFESQE